MLSLNSQLISHTISAMPSRTTPAPAAGLWPLPITSSATPATAIAKRFGCQAYGSSSLSELMRLHGIAEQAVVVEPYKTYELGPFTFSFTPSLHSKLLLGLAVPADGELTCDHLDALNPGTYR